MLSLAQRNEHSKSSPEHLMGRAQDHPHKIVGEQEAGGGAPLFGQGKVTGASERRLIPAPAPSPTPLRPEATRVVDQRERERVSFGDATCALTHRLLRSFAFLLLPLPRSPAASGQWMHSWRRSRGTRAPLCHAHPSSNQEARDARFGRMAQSSSSFEVLLTVSGGNIGDRLSR